MNKQFYIENFLGKKVEMTEDMKDDPNPIKAGEKGVVIDVDDLPSLFVRWESGRTLYLMPNLDKFRLAS